MKWNGKRMRGIDRKIRILKEVTVIKGE